MPRKKIRLMITAKGYHSLGIGFGYWPCLKGVFLRIFILNRRIDIWYGLESYKNNAEIRKTTKGAGG